jgi:PAS domain S-box-containing protein
MKILIVDDREEGRYMLEVLLREHGYEVESAADGVEALEKALQNGFDMIISDILMPRMDGFQLCREVKTNEKLKKIPFIFYTAAYIDPKDEEFALKLGAEKFIIKPTEPYVFIDILKKLIRSYESGTLAAPKPPIEKEAVYLREYNERLIKKLEDKMLQLERVNKVLKESEKKHRELIENANDAIVIIEPTGYFGFVNPKFCKMTGYSKEEATNLNYSKSIHPDDLDMVTKRFGKAMSKEVMPRSYEFRMLTKSREVLYVEVNTTPLKREEKVVGIQAIVRDITERRQAEQALHKLTNELTALYEASQVFLGQIEVETTLKNICRLAVEHFGLKIAWVGLIFKGDFIVHPVSAYGLEEDHLRSIRITWDDSPTGRGPIGTAIRTARAIATNRIETDPANAPWREAALTHGYRSSAALPLCYGDEVLGVLNVYSAEPECFTEDRLQVLQSLANLAALGLQKARLYDQAQRNAAELEKKVIWRTQQFQEANAELEAFAYSVSHDLRAPLRAMQGFAQALLEDYAERLDPGGQEYAQRIVSAAQRMDTLIRDLLEYSRLSRAEMEPQSVDLEQVVNDIITQVDVQIWEMGAQVRVEKPLPKMMGHKATLNQVVANLLTNAVKFVAPGVQARVRIWAEEREDKVRLWVEDNGIGIPSEHQGRIFRVFERLHGLETYPGTGIGLAIVRKGMERMGGQVGVESTPGKGSRFWVELPKGGEKP